MRQCNFGLRAPGPEVEPGLLGNPLVFVETRDIYNQWAQIGPLLLLLLLLLILVYLFVQVVYTARLIVGQINIITIHFLFTHKITKHIK